MLARIASIILVCVTGLSYLGYRQLRNTPASSTTLHAPFSAPIGYQVRNIREQRALDLLAAVGNTQPTYDILSAVVSWSLAEDSSMGAIERNNLWNTTMCGYNMLGSINSDGACGVQSYATPADGIAASAATLAQGNFKAVTDALRSNDVDGFKRALWASDWAASHYNYGAGWPHYEMHPAPRVAGKKCPYTDTMKISTPFNAVYPVYDGQYGSMHLGVDLTGNPGDPVYAPFDMTVDGEGSGVTYAADYPYTGWRIQAHFNDGTLYYAGHLIDVYVSAGQFVAACEVIATLGATAGPHVHVKLAGSNAPIPCESSPPGEYGCIDPIEYWESH
jgi:murein DD-endopeptidase MepM/ murein hydrolase activator NlpD